MSFLLFIFVLALILILSLLSFGISIIRGLLSLIFPGLRRSSSSPFRRAYSEEDVKNRATSDASSGRKKIFDSNEGDYADYEEIKN